jgi:hypothetical protein
MNLYWTHSYVKKKIVCCEYGPRKLGTKCNLKRYHYLGNTTLSIMTFSITTFIIVTLSIMIFGINIKQCDTQHNDTSNITPSVVYAECRVFDAVMLSVKKLCHYAECSHIICV